MTAAAAEFVGSVNGGNRTVPTVKFADGSTLTNPSAGEVKAKLAEVAGFSRLRRHGPMAEEVLSKWVGARLRFDYGIEFAGEPARAVAPDPVRPTADDGPQKMAYHDGARRFGLQNLSPRAGRFAKRWSLIRNAFAAGRQSSSAVPWSLISGCSHRGHSGQIEHHARGRYRCVDRQRRRCAAHRQCRRSRATSSKRTCSKPPPADANAPGPCRAVGHNDLTFGSSWSEFRSAGYHGVTDDITPGGNSLVNGVTQAVARYPNAGARAGRIPSAGFDAASVC